MSLECCSWNLVHDPPLEPLHVTLGSQRNTDLVSASCTSLFTQEPRRRCSFLFGDTADRCCMWKKWKSYSRKIQILQQKKPQKKHPTLFPEADCRLSARRIFMSDFLQSLFLSVPPLSFVTVPPIFCLCDSSVLHFSTISLLNLGFSAQPSELTLTSVSILTVGTFLFLLPDQKGSSVFSATSAQRYFFMFMFSNTLGGRSFSKPRN